MTIARRSARPTDVVRLDLSGGDWIEIKKDLTALEAHTVFARMAKFSERGSEYDVKDHALLIRPAQYLIAWSFVDDEGRPIVWPSNLSLEKRIEVLGSLWTATVAEINTAIDGHEARRAEEREKNAPVNAPGSTPSSPSAG